MNKVRFGIIGVGIRGLDHARIILRGEVENATLTAVCDINPEKLDNVRKQYPDIKCYENYIDMLESGDIDAVIIAVPHYDHPKMSIDAFERGVHVMCEKPAGVYGKQVLEMNAAHKKYPKVVFGMMFNQRTNCVYRKMKEMVENGELGELRRSIWIITDWYRPQVYYDCGDWRATWKGEGGGVLLNQCPHNLDLWQWICGMPQKMTAFLSEGKWHNIEVEDDVTAYAEYANGATGVFITTTADYPGTNRFEVSGDLGKLVCENNKLTFFKNRMSEREYNKTGKEAFGGPGFDVVEVETDGKNPQHAGVLNAFADNIVKGTPLTAMGEEGINGLTLSNAMHLSAWTGKTVELPLDHELFYNELKKKL